MRTNKREILRRIRQLTHNLGKTMPQANIKAKLAYLKELIAQYEQNP